MPARYSHHNAIQPLPALTPSSMRPAPPTPGRHPVYTDLPQRVRESLGRDLDRMTRTLERAELTTKDLEALKWHGEPTPRCKLLHTDSDRQYYIQLQIDANKFVCKTLKLILTTASHVQRGNCTVAAYGKAQTLLIPLLETFRDAAGRFNQRLHILQQGKSEGRANIPDLWPLAQPLEDYDCRHIVHFIDTLEVAMQYLIDPSGPHDTPRPSEDQ